MTRPRCNDCRRPYDITAPDAHMWECVRTRDGRALRVLCPSCANRYRLPASASVSLWDALRMDAARRLRRTMVRGGVR
ncbi:hypothetical protein [Bifidobacterium avesanii]|uniref:Uncharacterized protein n=1 Tax=Bifidobacterium avesanii TaxID=1798157 RepID=A0A7K3TG59_9BIFI|nr:hypothetical protein [Bifidobacterium avesanii]KAB8294527.1 hypothetical protein DSM100685_0320 [Bifidobacterium avesanii]NEG78042.1 hypothetical protein [Bifidobacterium avesanii]